MPGNRVGPMATMRKDIQVMSRQPTAGNIVNAASIGGAVCGQRRRPLYERFHRGGGRRRFLQLTHDLHALDALRAGLCAVWAGRGQKSCKNPDFSKFSAQT